MENSKNYEPATDSSLRAVSDEIEKNLDRKLSMTPLPTISLCQVIARLKAAEKERGYLRQRVQQAEKAARITVETCRKQGVGLAKYLAYHHIEMLEKELSDLQHDMERAQTTMSELATENDKLRKEWEARLAECKVQDG